MTNDINHMLGPGVYPSAARVGYNANRHRRTSHDTASPICKVIRPTGTYEGKQRLCMHLLNIPPRGRAKAHLHEQESVVLRPDLEARVKS
jgi:hypothetical protein